MTQTIINRVKNGIGYIEFNRPEHANSMGRTIQSDLEECVKRMSQSDVRVVVITGRGKYFNSGGDISEFQKSIDELDHLVDDILKFAHPAINQLANLPKPIISAINGPFGGAGIGFALCADFILASVDAKLRGGYCAIGLTPDMGASYFLTKRVGPSKAKQIFMMNQAISAEECLRLGMVDQVLKSEELMPTVDALAKQLASGATSAFGRAKQLCDKANSHDLGAHLELEHELLIRSAASQDCKEGVSAFLEKRVPRFVGH